MKKTKNHVLSVLIVFALAASLLFSLPLSYANDAPVEELSIESTPLETQAQTQTPSNSTTTTTTSPNDAQSQSMSTQSQSSDDRYNDDNIGGNINHDNDNNNDSDHDNVYHDDQQSSMDNEGDVADMASANQKANSSDETRLDRLEQQMSNITEMNLPQQIAELRQEVQQLNGRIQVQQHDIKILENQQLGFYQDLNRRIQRVANSNDRSMTQQKKTKVVATPVKSLSARATATSADLKDSASYRFAFNLLVKKQYDDALKAFQNYIRRYPRGSFIANAYYWIGELYLKKNNVKKAAESFERVITQFPRSNKVPDAKLKQAIIHVNQGHIVQAKKEFNQIKRQYPNSSAAQLATIQLERMAE